MAAIGYNLHLVLVAAERYRMGEEATLLKVRDTCLRIADKKGYAISALAVMPDHVHMALRGAIAHSPEVIALAFLNNLAFALGQCAFWQSGYYAGTFSEYDMDAVRSFVGGIASQTASPAGRAARGRERGGTDVSWPNCFTCRTSRQGSDAGTGGRL